MKICPKCQAQLDDSAKFCTNCGTQFAATNNGQQAQYNNYYQPPYDPYDHTAEFDPKDISDNKVMSMLVYLMSWIGIIIALLGSHNSPYAAFHVRQVVNVLMLICTLLLFWTFIVPIAYGVMSIVFFVIKIICFFQICSGKAKEPAIIRNLKFLK